MVSEEQLDTLADDLNEAFEYFLESLQGDLRFLRPVTENDYCTIENCEFVYTDRGMTLVENYLRRLYSIAERYSEDHGIEIESYLYREE